MRLAVILLLAFFAAGCGHTAQNAGDHAAGLMTPIHCQRAMSTGIAACGYPLGKSTQPSSIWSGSRDDRQKIVGPARIEPVEGAGPVGFWVSHRIFLAPDGRTLLAQWSGECESQSTYLVPRAGGKPRLVFLSESRALGWSKDGRARVVLAEPGAFDGERGYHQGTYLVDPVTMKRTLVWPAQNAANGC